MSIAVLAQPPLGRDYRAIPIALVVAASIAALLPGCSGGPTELRFSGPTMGTTFNVTVLPTRPGDEARRRLVAETIVSELDRIEASMSTYRHDSEVSQFNRLAPHEPMNLSRDMLEVVQLAQEISAMSDGAFDITVGPLVDLWGFGPAPAPAKPPDATAIEELMERTGYDRLLIDAQRSTLTKTTAGVRIDLSAIAKGYAVDRVGESLERLGYRDYLVEVGGEVRTRGLGPSGPWRVAIESPTPGRRELSRVLALGDESIATSGNYRNFYEVEGKLYSHEIDPRAGRPVSHEAASVTVIHETTASADALATALMVLGPDNGLQLAENRNLTALFLVHRDGDWVEVASASMARRLVEPGTE